jgi:hypothetical protein
VADIDSSQFEHFVTDSTTGRSVFFSFKGVKTRGAGEGKPFMQGEIGEGRFSGKGGLLSISFSGDSISLSPT